MPNNSWEAFPEPLLSGLEGLRKFWQGGKFLRDMGWVKPGWNLGLNSPGCPELLKIWEMNAQQKLEEEF